MEILSSHVMKGERAKMDAKTHNEELGNRLNAKKNSITFKNWDLVTSTPSNVT